MSKLAQELKSRTILQGDVLDKLKEIPDESIDCIISSPLYWGLRDYGVEGQIGLEPDFREFLKSETQYVIIATTAITITFLSIVGGYLWVCRNC